MLRVGAEPVKQICGRRAGRETLCFRGIGVLLIGRILGQLADAVVREADSAIDIIAEGFVEADLALGQTVEDGVEFIQQLQGGLGIHRASIAKGTS